MKANSTEAGRAQQPLPDQAVSIPAVGEQLEQIYCCLDFQTWGGNYHAIGSYL